MLFNESLSITRLGEEWTKYNNVPSIKNTLRFGQYVCNQYLKDGIACPDIYYEENDDKAFSVIVSHLYTHLGQ